MQLMLVFAILGALAVADAAQKAPVDGAARRAMAAAIIMLLPVLFAAVSAAVTAGGLRRRPWSRGLLLRRFGQMRTVHSIVWLTCAAVVLYALDWTRLVRFNCGFDRWPLVDDLLIMLPVLGPLVLSWAAFYEVDRAARASAVRWSADVGENEAIWTRWQYVGYQLRTCAGIVLAPLAVLIVVQDLIRLIAPTFMEGEHAWAAYVPPFVLVVVLFPVVLRHVWRCEPLPAGPLRSRLEAASRRTGLRVREILVWHTGRMVVNAAVAGFLPQLRYVFLSDALLRHMTDEEIEAVFGHEVGHIRHHHVFLRALVLLAPLSLYFLLGGVAGGAPRSETPAAVDARQNVAGAAVEAPAAPRVRVAAINLAGLDVRRLTTAGMFGIAATAAVGIYIVIVFGFCSRKFERQADLFGCRVISAEAAVAGASSSSRTAPWNDAPTVDGVRVFIGALEKLALLNGIGRAAPSWQHASIARRVAFLESVVYDPRQASRCDRQVRLLGSIIVGVVAAGFAWPLIAGW
jgi:STE24 endopeptidase